MGFLIHRPNVTNLQGWNQPTFDPCEHVKWNGSEFIGATADSTLYVALNDAFVPAVDPFEHTLIGQGCGNLLLSELCSCCKNIAICATGCIFSPFGGPIQLKAKIGNQVVFDTGVFALPPIAAPLIWDFHTCGLTCRNNDVIGQAIFSIPIIGLTLEMKNLVPVPITPPYILDLTWTWVAPPGPDNILCTNFIAKCCNCITIIL